MKKLQVEGKRCRNCDAPMKAGFFVYVPENERHDRWLESMDSAEKYCDRCFRDTSQVVLFTEFFCPRCGDYTGIYMECTPYSKAHFLAEISPNIRK